MSHNLARLAALACCTCAGLAIPRSLPQCGSGYVGCGGKTPSCVCPPGGVGCNSKTDTCSAPPAGCLGGTGGTIVELAYSDTPVVIGNHTDNRGDGLTFANTVMDAANRSVLGSDQGYCSRTAVGSAGAYHCHFTVTFLDDSQLMLMGPFYDKPRGKDGNLGVMAVVGGTGSLQGVRGQMTLVPRPSALPKVEYFFNFCLFGGPSAEPQSDCLGIPCRHE